MFFSEDENMKRRRELEANDFYDSDDDTYLDRTGAGINVIIIHKLMFADVFCHFLPTGSN